MPDRTNITFVPLVPADLPMLADWMGRAHWREWWGEPEEEVGFVRDMLEGRDTTRPFLFHLDGVPEGYIQVWYVRAALVEPWLTAAPWLTALPPDAVGVDLSLARGECLSKGIGSAVLRAFVAMLRAEGHESIVIDPAPDNARALAAYRKAGFRPVPALLGKTTDCIVMQHEPEMTEA